MTGLIYLVIIGLWAAVLIPIWLRRHDQISEVRSTARFSSAMKTLSEGGGEMPSDRRPPSRRSDRRNSTSTGRIIVMGLLTVALAGALAMAVMGQVPRPVPIGIAVVLVGFLVLTAASRASRRRAERRRPPLRRVEFAESPNVDDDLRWPGEPVSEDFGEIIFTDEVGEFAYPDSRGTLRRPRPARDARVAAAMEDYLSWDPWEEESFAPRRGRSSAESRPVRREYRPASPDQYRGYAPAGGHSPGSTTGSARSTDLDQTNPTPIVSDDTTEIPTLDTSELPVMRYQERRRASGQ